MSSSSTNKFDILVLGGGSAGIAITASILARDKKLKIGIIEPKDKHYYQPAWTLVGGGAFNINDTVKSMHEVVPARAQWIQAEAQTIDPDNNQVILKGNATLHYDQLIVCTGLRIRWDKIEGLEETIGKNGVTSNYRFDLAPYTWELVKNLKGGTALFTQPPMPIKCAGAPQKAMYLSCDHWLKSGTLNKVKVQFNNAGGVLFGVKTYVEPLMQYIRKYNIDLAFNSNLVKVDGPNQRAWFEVKDSDGNVTVEEKEFDMMHVVPPQVAPCVVKNSPLANDAGWCKVDQHTLQNPDYPNVFALGDVVATTNAKTAAATRKQVVVVAENLLAYRVGGAMDGSYDGYGSCPLTVEKGKVILAEFGYGGKLLPTFALDSTKPRKSAWFLKATMLPWVYWNLMLKGKEWLTKTTPQ